MTDELKPCPFCGGRASFSTPKAAGYAFYVAECLDCKALLSKLSKGELLTNFCDRNGAAHRKPSPTSPNRS